MRSLDNYLMDRYKSSDVKQKNEKSKNIADRLIKKLSCSNRDGFTLVELMVSAVLILIISTLFINFIAYTLQVRTVAKERLIAMSMAVETMEEISSVQGEAWSERDDLVTWIKGENMEFTSIEEDNTYFKEYDKYAIFIFIDDEQPKKEDGTRVDELFKVTVTVKYDSDREVNLTTLFREV